MSLTDIAKTFALKKLPDSAVELTGEVPFETLAPYQAPALKHISEHLDLPGFRKGHVPAEMARKKVGEIHLLEEAVELFIQDFYPALITTHAVNAVGRPAINITKLAPQNPVGLTVRASVYPDVTLPKNWQKIHEQVAPEPASPTTDEEIDKTLESLRASSAKATDGQAKPLPEMTDEWAKSVGAFESLDALKAQITKGITAEKERAAKDKRRGKIIDALLEKVSVEVPAIFIESELEKILAQLKEDVSRFGLKFEEYLKQVKKTEDEVRADFREQAKKRAALQLALNKIAEVEKVEADQAMMEQELKHALEHFPDAKPELVKIHIETVLRNEKVLKLLEGEK
ncbi:MAG: trigger factor [Patescibacteria group bacterium]